MVSAAAISDRIWLYLLLNSITSRRILRVVGRMEEKSAIMAVMSEIILIANSMCLPHSFVISRGIFLNVIWYFSNSASLRVQRSA